MKEIDAPWKILIVDDEQDVIEVTKICLQDISYQDRDIELLEAQSEKEARKIYLENKDLAVIFLDVVMEERDSGLKFIEWIRKQQGNHLVKIILRTGYPGLAPENKVIYNYEINEYLEKTDFTYQKVQTLVVTSLRSYQKVLLIQEHEQKMRELVTSFKRLIPFPLIELLGKKSVTELTPTDHIEKELTFMFLDIFHFGKIAEKMRPIDTYNFVRGIFDRVQPPIYHHGGFIDKFIGDAFLAIFPLGPDGAIKAAIEIQKIVAEMHESEEKYSSIEMAAGINTGTSVVGVIGRPSRLECTVFGDSVNIAKRLEETTKLLRAYTIISEESYQNLNDPTLFHTRNLGYVSIKHKVEPIKVYEVFDDNSKEMIEKKEKSKEKFSQAIQAYYDTDFEEAATLFGEIVAENPKDFPATKYLELSKKCLADGVPKNWSGTLDF